MKINIILPLLGRSGGADVVYKYTELLTAHGHDVVVYSPIIAFDLKRYKSRLINTAHQLYCSAKGLLRLREKRSEADKRILTVSDRSVRDADVVIATSWPTSFCVDKLAPEKGEKVYFVQDFEIWDNEEYGLKSYALPLHKIVISTWINEQLQERLGIGPFPVVYNGLDTVRFSNLGKVYKKEGETIRCLMLNHVLSKKGVEAGVRAFELAKETCPNMTLEAFGLCDRGALPDYVEYIRDPSREQLVEMYSRADIFIFPSYEEGWGLTPLEAMACQCAVAGTRTGFVLDLGEHGVNMMISKPGDVEGLANNIARLAVDRQLLRQLSESGAKTAGKLRWDDSYKRFEHILLRLIDQKTLGENRCS